MKKILSVLICVLMLLSSLSTLISAYTVDLIPLRDDGTYILGDVNSDGDFNALDANTLRQYHMDNATEISMDSADINGDGAADTKDIFYLKAFSAEALKIDDFKGDYPVYSLTVGGNPIAQFDIVVPADTDVDTSNAYLSATIMKKYIKKVCGADVAISFGESTKAHGIYYHPVAYDSKECEELKLGLENYIYKVTDGDLHIFGSVRGNMYATYEILEKFCGLRFFSDEYTYSYDMRCADIPEGTDVYFEVPYEFRYAGSSVANLSAFYSYYLALGCNGTPIYAGGDQFQGYQVGPRFALGHSFGYYKNVQSVPMPEGTTAENLQQKLQEKYTLGNSLSDNDQNWQPCCSSDEEYYRMFNGMLETVQMVQTWGYSNEYSLEKAKVASYANTFSINDSLKACTCTICTAKINGTSMTVRRNTLSQLEHYTGEYTLTNKNKTLTFKKEGISGLFLDFCNRAAIEITTEYHGYDYTYGMEEESTDFPDLYAPPFEGVRTVYPEISLNMIIYDHTVPESVRPVSNIQIMYVSHGCYNHYLGSGECGDMKTTLHDSNKTDDYAMVEWGKMCNEAGASIWYYSHGINYACHLAPSPNILDFYYNAQYVRRCGFNGILYEGDHADSRRQRISFENLKAYLAAKLAFNPDITYEEFTDMVKEYMYMYYGEGFEEVYQYMLLQQAAGDAAPCWTNNHDRPFDEYEPSYIKAHYEEMRELVMTAIEKADDGYTKKHCSDLLVSCDFLGLSACYKDMYANGTAQSRAAYEERYTNLYNYIKDNNIPIYSDDVYKLPAAIDFSSDPMKQFISFASWRGVAY